MMDLMDIVVIAFFGLAVIVPAAILVITQYREPECERATLRRVAGHALTLLGVYIVFDVIRFGTSFHLWGWDIYLPMVAIGAAVAVLIDFLVLRRRRRTFDA